jgi:dihydroorotate dehydrogenase
MYRAIRPLLFQLEPERAHDLTIQLLRLAGALPPVRAFLRAYFRGPDRPVELFGLKFRNPVGLAAGYDKDGLAWRGLACLGFSHLELGTVTPRPQDGNPRPRVFRLPADRAVINRMGFPGRGADFLRGRLDHRPRDFILGINLGKNKVTPLETAHQDYLSLMRTFARYADYLAVNVSSPNTVGLRSLQARAQLTELLTELQAERQEQAAALGKNVPLLVKLAPDLNEHELADALEALMDAQVDGVIATNTTLQRPKLNSANARETGGLSGAPLSALSTHLIARINALTSGKLPIIAVGGVMDAAEARAKLDAGAALVQVYTGLIYSGPGLVREILSGLGTQN